MTGRDLIYMSAENLRRLKFRTSLTVAGVVIAIGTFVAMLSFGAGNQALVEREFEKLGLLTTMQVFPKVTTTNGDTIQGPQLDSAAVERLSHVPGVNLVYPYDAFSVSVKIGDSVFTSKAQALPASAVQTKLFSNLVAGHVFDSSTAGQAIVSQDVLKHAGIASPESLIGKSIVLSVKVSKIDSGFAHILVDRGESIVDRLRRIHVDSLRSSGYRKTVVRQEINQALRRFMNGFSNAQEVLRDTLKVCGIREQTRGRRLRIEDVIIPFGAAARLRSSGTIGSLPDLFTAMNNGTLFGPAGAEGAKSFPQVTIDFDPNVLYKTVRDSVEAMGFRTFSFAAEFEQIQKVFVYFDLALGVIGLIALITASLGIVNTMVMSITERRREIGVLKSLGAYELDIRQLFLVESGVIGVIGAAGGIVFGWSVTRIVSAVAQAYMKREGFPEVELFSLPLWLILIALAVGVTVSVAAGLYPAARAARIDPVEALRND